MADNLINHVAIEIDASSSVSPYKREIVQVVDGLIKELADRSQEHDQETRVTVYSFADRHRIKCHYFDRDVMRFKSIADEYSPYGNTALVAAVLGAIDDLKSTSQRHGNHAFLNYCITDGEENDSTHKQRSDLPGVLAGLPSNWTNAALVPNQGGVREAKRYGWPEDNIAVWDVSRQGVVDLGEKITQATNNYMVMRSKGIHSTTGLFKLDLSGLTPTVVRGTLQEMDPNHYKVYPVISSGAIRDVVEEVTGKPYIVNSTFYELTKKETIQPQKHVIVRDRDTNKLYGGQGARDLLGLPNYHVDVAPSDHPKYDIFVQSTSYTRKMVPNTEMIVVR